MENKERKKLEKELKIETVKGVITVLRVTTYRDCPIYIRMLEGKHFEYMVIYKNEIYSSYITIEPKEGKTKLSHSDINKAAGVIFAGAVSTIDELLEIEAQATEDAKAS